VTRQATQDCESTSQLCFVTEVSFSKPCPNFGDRQQASEKIILYGNSKHEASYSQTHDVNLGTLGTSTENTRIPTQGIELCINPQHPKTRKSNMKLTFFQVVFVAGAVSARVGFEDKRGRRLCAENKDGCVPLFNPCCEGYSCHIPHRECYAYPRRANDPCIPLVDECVTGYTCDASRLRCREMGTDDGDRCSISQGCANGMICKSRTMSLFDTSKKILCIKVVQSHLLNILLV
jgi:hypothetical protein